MTNPDTQGLPSRQWANYRAAHRTRGNLLIHVVAVPLFILGNVVLVVALARGAWLVAGLAVLLMAASLGAQGRGHRREPMQPEPFSGLLNALARLLAEQWITFPRFVVSGGWAAAWRRG